MNKEELIEKIISKAEFSELPRNDVEKAFEKFDKEEYNESEKVKFTRDLLKRVFTAFMGRKIRNPKDKDARWFLLRHVSTKERFDYYEKVYSRVLKGFDKCSIIDLGCGINGLSYEYFKKLGNEVNYLGIEAVGQLVNVSNYFFEKNKYSAKAVQMSLFELEKIKGLIKKQKKPRICFLFKSIDSLEMLERNYTKKFLDELVSLCDIFVVSFAMKSFFKRENFKVRRSWAIKYIEENFEILEDFEFGGEKYIVFRK